MLPFSSCNIEVTEVYDGGKKKHNYFSFLLLICFPYTVSFIIGLKYGHQSINQSKIVINLDNKLFEI